MKYSNLQNKEGKKMLWPIGLIEKGEDKNKGVDKFFESLELAKVLSMEIPACLIVQLPRAGGTEDNSDVLLCFPCNDCVHAYIYTMENHRANFIDLGKFGDGEKSWGIKDEKIKRYQYVVSLGPFLYHLPKTQYVVQFRFQIQRIGHNVLEITAGRDEKGDPRWVEINYYDRTNEYWYSRGEGKQQIAKLVKKETKDGYIWIPTEEKSKIHELPFIQGYMTEE